MPIVEQKPSWGDAVNSDKVQSVVLLLTQYVKWEIEEEQMDDEIVNLLQ